MYDLYHLINGVWTPTEQIRAASRRQAMKMIRRDGSYLPSGSMHGRFKVAKAVDAQ